MREGDLRAASLKRQLGLLDSLSIGLGAIIGAGIFVLIGIAAGLAGPAVLLAVLISCLSATFTALSFAELASALPKAGGVYEYGRALIHPIVGFLMGWMWVAGNIILSATASQGFGYYLSALVPVVDYKAAAAMLVIAVSVVNALGTRLSAGVNNVLVVAKTAVLLFLVGVGLWRVEFSNFTPFVPHGFTRVLEATALFYFAYIGFPRVSALAEEVKDPEKNLPKAILFALWISALIYLLVTYTAVGVSGWVKLSESKAPLETVARQLGIPWVVGVGGLLATLSVVLTSVMGQSRVFFAMARNGEIPTFLARVHERFKTPFYAVALSSVVMLVLVLTIDITGLAMSTSFLILMSHVFTNIAAFQLYRRRVEAPFKAPSRPLHCVLGMSMSLLLALSVERRAQIFGAAIAAAGVAWYSFYVNSVKKGLFRFLKPG
ncbi:MAG: APC family permease [Thermofilaceae archaeon]|nr:APC family permease [Thermofilaceae archaeon]